MVDKSNSLDLELLGHVHSSEPFSLLPTGSFIFFQAIDLIDEATARVKMEKTLKPELLDKMERRIRDLESERR